MADKKQVVKPPVETSKIDALYSWLSYDLQKMKKELLTELKYSSVQVGSLCNQINSDKEKSAQAVSQEIRYSYKQNQTIYDGLAAMIKDAKAKVEEAEASANEKFDAQEASFAEKITALKDNASEKLSSVETNVNDKIAALEANANEKFAALEASASEKLEAIKAALEELRTYPSENLAETVEEEVSDVIPTMEETLNEIKYGYLQQQAIYEGMKTLITDDVVAKVNAVEEKLAILEQLDKTLEEIHLKVAESITLLEDADYKTLIEAVAEKTEESVAEHSRKVMEAIAAVPVAENVDYTRIVDEVGDRVIELLGDVVQDAPAPAPAPAQPVEAKVDYEKLIYGTAEKVVESLPYPERVDYRRINDSFAKAAEKVQVVVTEETLANVVNAAVEKAMAAFNFNALAEAVAAKIVVPVPEMPDVDAIAEAVAAKIVIPEVQIPEAKAAEIDYDLLSDMVVAKLSENTDQAYDVVLDQTGIDQIAEKVTEKVGQAETVDYDRVAAIVEEKLEKLTAEADEEEPSYDLVLDDEGIEAIAKSVSEQLCTMCNTCTVAEEEVVEPTEEAVEEVVEEPVEETVVEEAVEEPAVEEVVEETVEETPAVSEELAVAVEAAEADYQEIDNQLVDAETGLVIRLKKSFTAKMKQSEDRIKGYYSDIKNELTSYKKINSNVSWHGDRFNFGRDTIAKVNICGKTLCFYLALDPEDPELKTTIYHQKNVGNQRAYENTPFMVKIKSDAAAKKAVRLVNMLAEKIGAQKQASFEAVDYVEEFAYASTKQLFDEGFIKVTKEKKVTLDF